MVTRLSQLLAFVVISCAVSTAYSDVILFGGGDNRIASITGLDVLGTANDGTYDVTFQYGVSYNLLSGNKITFTSFPDALTVMSLIAADVNAFGPVAGLRTDDVRLPISVIGSNVNNRIGVNVSAANYDDWFSFEVNDTTVDVSTSLLPNIAWVTFTAVPEPSSVALLGMVAIGLIGYHRLKQQQAA